MENLVLVAVFHDAEKARHLANEINGTLLCDGRQSTTNLPFSSLVLGASDDLAAFLQAAELGAYLVYRRVIKARVKPATDTAGEAIGIFAMVAHPDMGHELDA